MSERSERTIVTVRFAHRRTPAGEVAHVETVRR